MPTYGLNNKGSSRLSGDVNDGPGFQYTPLSSPTSMRLLRVLPKKRHGEIQIALWEVEAKDVIPYHCLSYTWGDPDNTTVIQVNGKPMQIRENLYGFLDMVVQRLSDNPESINAIWIDALCINQGRPEREEYPSAANG
jgi:hypothetical protein